MSINSKMELQSIENLHIKTTNAIIKGQRAKVKVLFHKVEQLFIKGNNYSQELIANQFILPLTHLLELNYSWGKEYLELLPKPLREEYCRQIIHQAYKTKWQ